MDTFPIQSHCDFFSNQKTTTLQPPAQLMLTNPPKPLPSFLPGSGGGAPPTTVQVPQDEKTERWRSLEGEEPLKNIPLA